jgi:hypothetical protein
VIAGTRDLFGGSAFRAHFAVVDAIGAFRDHCGALPSEVVSGHSGDVDLAGERWAQIAGVPVKLFHPNWTKYGRRAGPLRNAEMARYAAEGGRGALLLIWDGASKGSRNMLEEARKAGLLVHEVIIK